MPEGALIQWNQFVAGRKNGNPRLAKNPHRHSSNSREQANFRRAKPTAAPENHVARPRLASLAHHVLEFRDRAQHAHLRPIRFRMLHHHHCVGARRQRRARHDFHRLLGREGLLHAFAGSNFSDSLELGRSGIQIP